MLCAGAWYQDWHCTHLGNAVAALALCPPRGDQVDLFCDGHTLRFDPVRVAATWLPAKRCGRCIHGRASSGMICQPAWPALYFQSRRRGAMVIRM